jgi:uncharacterized protein (TIGR00369 family)
MSLPSRADQFEPASDEVVERWAKYGRWDRPYFPSLIGMEIEEVRRDYCRMRLPFRDDLEQPAGVVHGGAIASLLDSVVVPAVGGAYGADARLSTVDMHVQFMSALVRDDVVAEGWIVRRGRSVVFCESEARAASTGKLVARAVLTFNVAVP